MKNLISFLIGALVLQSALHAQTFQTSDNIQARLLSEPASTSNAKLTIRTEPLMNRTVEIQLNGQLITSLEGRQTYSGIFSPGKARITVPGDKPEGTIEFNVEPNREYIFGVELIASTSGAFAFGLIGSIAMGTFSIALKETREMFAVLPTQRPAQQGPGLPQPQAAPGSTGSTRVDFIAEAKKSALILGCPTDDVKVTGAQNDNLLMAASCPTGQPLLLRCDQSGVCLRR